MPVYGVTFRISEKPYRGHKYEDRYNSLIEAVRSLKPRLAWVEPTSFFLMDVMRPPPFVQSHIATNAILDPENDLVLGLIIRSGRSFVIGSPEDRVTLEKLRNLMSPAAT
jgi:hypothetical protein